MKKGYHIQLGFTEKEIVKIGEELLGSGTYQAIEIKYPYGMAGFNPESYLKGINELKSQFSPEITMHIPTNLDIGHTNPFLWNAILDEIKKSIDFAEEYDASVLAIHPGTIGTMDIPAPDGCQIKDALIQASQKKKEHARYLTVQALEIIASYIDGMPAVLALENVLLSQEIVYSPEELDFIINEVNRSNVKALFDCGHAFRCGIQPAEFLKQLKSGIAHVHVNDNDGTCDLHQSIGEGKIDYAPMFEVLKEKDYKGIILMETSYRNSQSLAEDAEKLDRYIGS